MVDSIPLEETVLSYYTPLASRLRLLLVGGVSFASGVQVVEWVGLALFNFEQI